GAYLTLLEILRRKGWADVVMFCGREHQRARTVEAWSSAEFVTDYEALVARSDVDVVVVLTPMAAHAAMAKAALAAGKHVLVEKPLATNLTDARELLAAARRCRKHLVCAPFTPLSPTFGVIAERLNRGEIGRVTSARGRYGWA